MAAKRLTFPAYAYEVVEGDRVDGREVTGVEDPDRPEAPVGHPVGPGEVTITFAKGDPLTADRMREVEISRTQEAVDARRDAAHPSDEEG